MKRLLFFVCMLFLAAAPVSAQQQGYELKFKIKNATDSVYYLVNYFGDKTYARDTAWNKGGGTYVFEGTEPLANGVYIVVAHGTKLMELAISKEQHFSVESDTFFLPEKIKIKGSQENIDFYQYLSWLNIQGKAVDKLREEAKSLEGKPAEAEKKKAEIRHIDTLVVNYRAAFIQQHQGQFLADMFNLMVDVEMPPIPTLANGRPDSTFRFFYYKTHYFDKVNWAQDGILRTPMFHSKIKNYLNNLTAQVPDSIIKEADYIVSLAKANKDVFKYCIQYITNTYETSNIMGMDAVFVHMAKQYYCSGQAFWVDEELKKKICDRALQLDPILIGKKTPNLILLDSSNRPHSLHQVNAEYTVLIFWASDCGHCQKAVPKLHEDVYKHLKAKGVEVYAVGTDSKLDGWKKFIIDHKLDWINVADPEQYSNYKYTYDLIATPLIFILDKDKKILAKKLDIEQVKDFLDHQMQKEKKSLN